MNPSGVGAQQNLLDAITEEPYSVADFSRLMDQWLPLTFAMNSLNRSMGQPDSYPFIIRPEVVSKLAFIHRVCRGAASLLR